MQLAGGDGEQSARLEDDVAAVGVAEGAVVAFAEAAGAGWGDGPAAAERAAAGGAGRRAGAKLLAQREVAVVAGEVLPRRPQHAERDRAERRRLVPHRMRQPRIELDAVIAPRVADDRVVVPNRVGERIERRGRDLIRSVVLARLERPPGLAGKPEQALAEAQRPLGRWRHGDIALPLTPSTTFPTLLQTH